MDHHVQLAHVLLARAHLLLAFEHIVYDSALISQVQIYLCLFDVFGRSFLFQPPDSVESHKSCSLALEVLNIVFSKL